MFCPKCKSEYREGISICADCGTELVEELPGEDQIQAECEYEYVEFVTIAETNNRGLIALAKSILGTEGIRYYMDDIQNYISGYTQLIQIQVPASDAVNARELLKNIGL